MDMNAAYREVGSYRAAATVCGTTPKTGAGAGPDTTQGAFQALHGSSAMTPVSG
jgi:hypothetical protein